MKKTTTFFLIAIVVSLFTLPSCSGDDNNVVAPSNTIVDFVARNSDYSSLGAALDRASLTAVLAGTTNYTVFAPNNAAFDAFLTTNGFANLEAVPVDVLTQVLLNHVVFGANNTSDDLNTGYIETLAEEATTGNDINMYLNKNSAIVLNGLVNITGPDIIVDNGVIHAVDAVIELPTVATFATADPTFGVLVQALTRETSFTYVTTLSTTDAPAPFTVFAPTDQAFTDLLLEFDDFSTLDDIPAGLLEATLNTHVVAGANVLSTTLTDGMTVNTLGDNFTINTTGGASFTDLNNRTGNIIVTDVQAANGVIHVVDKVILPQM